MSQGFELYLDDILEAIRRVELYTGGKSYEEFAEDILVQDGVLRNLANLGEAVKRLPAELTDLQPQIEWRKIAGLRDILVHEYGGVDLEIVWDVIQSKLPELKVATQAIRASSGSTGSRQS